MANKSKQQHMEYQRNLKLNSKNEEFIFYKSSRKTLNNSNSGLSPTFKPYKSKIAQLNQQKSGNHLNRNGSNLNSDHNKITSLKNALSNFRHNLGTIQNQKNKPQYKLINRLIHSQINYRKHSWVYDQALQQYQKFTGQKDKFKAMRRQEDFINVQTGQYEMNLNSSSNQNNSKQLSSNDKKQFRNHDKMANKKNTNKDNLKTKDNIIKKDIKSSENNYNQKLQRLTSKLREIAQNSYLTLKKQKSINLLDRQYLLEKNSRQKDRYDPNLSNELRTVQPSAKNNIIQRTLGNKNNQSNNLASYNYSQQLKKTRISQNNNKFNEQDNLKIHSQSFSLKRQKSTNKSNQAQKFYDYVNQDSSQNRYIVNKSIIQQNYYRPRGKTMANMQVAQYSYFQPKQQLKKSKVSINRYIDQSNRSNRNSISSSNKNSDRRQHDKNDNYHNAKNEYQKESLQGLKRSISFNNKNKVIKISELQSMALPTNNTSFLQQNILRKSNLKTSPQAISTQTKSNKIANAHNIKVHNSTINSIIMHSYNKTILTASNDYKIKQTNLQNQNQISIKQVRAHRGRVNVIRTIQDKLWSGGNDCYLRTDNQSWKMDSPVVQIYPQEKHYLNIGTSSTIERYNVQKRKTVQKIDVRTNFYQLMQKTNKQLYFGDNHSLYSIDWKMGPTFKKSLIKNDSNFVDEWIANPFNYQFCKVQGESLNFFDQKSKGQHKVDLKSRLLSHCWKQNKLFALTETNLLLYEHNKNYNSRTILVNNDYNICKMEIQSNKCVFGTTQGLLILRSL